ncbi:MAG: hypothetical protein R6T83_12870 [Salinibacter sp.]
MRDDVYSPPQLRSVSGPQCVAYGGLLVVLCGAAVLLGTGADVAARAAGLRLWALAAAALFAIAPSNVLLPDPNTRLLQRLNWAPGRLLRYQIERMGSLVVLGAVPAALLAYADPAAPLQHLGAKTAALGQALVLMVGAAGDSFAHFATLGPRSQAWQEGQAGTWYARAVEERGQGVSLPRGLVPALFATTRCFAVALAAVLVSGAGAQAGLPAVAWGAGLALLGWAVLRLRRHRARFDRHFYQTTAFYAEVMGGGVTATEREPVPFDALYWVPSRWRPAVWGSLRQLDRRLPLGRLVALAHAGLWLLCLRGAPSALTSGYVATLFIAQTTVCGLLTTPSAAPLPFQHTMQSVGDWIGTRTFVNLRWLAAHGGSLALVALFDDTYGAAWVGTWAAVHVALSLVAAAGATAVHEGRSRRAAA